MAAAKAALASFQTRLERQYPEAVRCLVDGFHLPSSRLNPQPTTILPGEFTQRKGT
jgi:hypothetical protein